MAVNPTPSLLDGQQITKRTFDADNDAIRTVQAVTTGFDIEVSAADGDSVMTVGTTDGTTSGTQKVLKTSTSGELHVKTLGNLLTVDYDYLSINYASATQEIYTYKTGGSGGSTVATVTINYTDATKANITNLART